LKIITTEVKTGLFPTVIRI